VQQVQQVLMDQTEQQDQQVQRARQVQQVLMDQTEQQDQQVQRARQVQRVRQVPRELKVPSAIHMLVIGRT
jgi:hypothetical protein